MRRLVLFLSMLGFWLAASAQKKIGYSTYIGDYKYTVISANEVEIARSYRMMDLTGKITLPSDVTIDGWTYRVTQIAERGFILCKFSEIVLPNTIKKIGKEAFNWCDNLKRITIPGSVTRIEDETFYFCGKLSEVNIPNSVTYIGKQAFGECKFLSEVYIPNSVTYIGSQAFAFCSLVKIVVPDGGLEYYYNIFSGNRRLKSVRGNTVEFPEWLYKVISLEQCAEGTKLYRQVYAYTYSYKNYAYDKIVEQLKAWQQKKEFETTAQWQQRVTKENQEQQAEKIELEVRNEYIEKHRPDKLQTVLGSYDADYEVFPLAAKGVETCFIKVPQSDAEYVKSKWKKAKLSPTYGVVNDLLGITSLTCKVGKKVYHSVQVYPDDRSSDLAINLPAVEIKLDGSKENVHSRPVSVDNSIDRDIPTNPTHNRNTFVVIIGNEKYQHVSSVPYAQNDAKVFAEYCRKTLGIPEKNIRCYQNATFGVMLAAMEDIEGISHAYNGNISVIFYYAGHGIPNERTGDAYLLPTDANGRQMEACYPLKRLYEELGALNARNVVAFIDACFSGSERGSGMLMAARGVAIKAKTTTPKGKMVVFTAAGGDETAYPYAEKGHGLFTYFLLKKLRDSKGNCTLEELADFVTKHVSQESVVTNGKRQTPSVSTSPALGKQWKGIRLR